MIEIPEAKVISNQANQQLTGKMIAGVTAAQSPHKFAWYSGDPAGYPDLLTGKKLGTAVCRGGMVEISVEDVTLLFTDGINLRYLKDRSEIPAKHQLLIEFFDGSYLSASVAMYGGLWCYRNGTHDNPYYLAACQKPSPLSDGFTSEYFDSLFLVEKEKYSLKAFLATEQCIPGLGNGVLQDILYHARCHPKRKVFTLTSDNRKTLYQSIRNVLKNMAEQGGRDTEVDLFGKPGGYLTRLSRNTVGKPCAVCGNLILKQPYLGGSIYFCPVCQPEINFDQKR